MSVEPMWRPAKERMERSEMARFMAFVRERTGKPVANYAELHTFSVERIEEFWTLFLVWSGVRWEGDLSPARQGERIEESRFFPSVRLNFAENLLRYSDGNEALIGISESRERVAMTYAELHREVNRIEAALRALGVSNGDRVAAVVPNIPEAVIAMLATTRIGAIWASGSPDFGVEAILDRFSEIGPKILIGVNAYRYGQELFPCGEKLAEIRRRLPTVEALIEIELIKGAPMSDVAHAWEKLSGDGPPPCERLPFNHPALILFSSGTTGKPKCIVHGGGGTLVQHAKELLLHTDLTRADTIIYFTTCGWMMWNWLVSSLFVGCRVVLYDGSPATPHLKLLWELADQEGITVLGTSAKFLSSCRKSVRPNKVARLTTLRTILSTGSPLMPEEFDWVYRDVKSDVQLASISGGTDIVSCFMLGNPLLPVHRGEIQGAGLGMDIAAFNAAGEPVIAERGELVCRRPFPSMPVMFWNDPTGERYRRAYFDRYPNVWTHGDFVSMFPHGGIVVHGRSDATLNPGGVRIGTAEIYRLVERMPEIADSLVIGLPTPDGDVRVVLFVRLAEAVRWSEPLLQKIKAVIREGASPRHVPRIVRPIEKIPYTLSGKKVELAVRDLLMGFEPQNKEALADPSALEIFRGLRI